MIGPGFDGLLTSQSTRIPGLVSVADVAPDGPRTTRTGSRPRPRTTRWRSSRRSTRASTRTGASGRSPPFSSACSSWRSRSSSRAAALLAFATGLAANLSSAWPACRRSRWCSRCSASRWRPVRPCLRWSHGRGSPLPSVSPPSSLGYLVAFLLDPAVVALSPLGPSQNARFFGLSNLLSAMLLVPVLAAVTLLKQRLGLVPRPAARSCCSGDGCRKPARGRRRRSDRPRRLVRVPRSRARRGAPAAPSCSGWQQPSRPSLPSSLSMRSRVPRATSRTPSAAARSVSRRT